MEAPSPVSEPLLERRRFPRLTLKAPVQFRNLLKPTESFAGSLSKNLSASGLAMIASTTLAKEERLILLLSLPAELKPIRVIGRVAWSRPQGFSQLCECGIQFIEVAPPDRDRIAEFVERGVVAL